MTELFQIAGKPVRRGDRVFHGALTRDLGERWVEILELADADRVRVRVLEGGGKGAVPSIQIADLRWEECCTEERMLEIYSQLEEGSGLALEALSLLRARDRELKRAVETEQALRGRNTAQGELLTQQNELLSCCLTLPNVPVELSTGISNAMLSLTSLIKPAPPMVFGPHQTLSRLAKISPTKLRCTTRSGRARASWALET
ncbi:hypothetical protein [Pseudomonas baetica]|uniref:hypothetical protein n=1 Tax=Pseudomonas baetica TaxID=674054 RepID=UPI0024065721|nr:hypothetical protein [Pseudomonas baetica]MDF9779024.1 hypothetical protein [Pseudomonas baetica]